MFSYRISRLIILLFVFLFNVSLFAQERKTILQKKIDSLTTILNKNSSSDTLTVSRMNTLACLLAQEKKSELAISYAQKAKKISEKLNFKKGIVAYHTSMGAIQREADDAKEAINSLNTALKLSDTSDKKEKSFIYDQLGHAYYWGVNDTLKALNIHKEALKLRKESKDLLLHAYSHDNIAQIYTAFPDYNEALYHYEQALALYVKLNSSRAAMAAGNAGLINTWMGNHNEALKNQIFAAKRYEIAKD